ncbi:hypothetical protein G5C51_36415 [Streptomyces sp. A7024]|uniref:Uncharacterized protein n=1 Tax=Streptomyces coryli TaxID=1128680 RepID=A0A6G4UAV3_9ACTN|nr:hypothetical protein [Streptomyces coryli]NGN69359.1 hypothetical protein [Streptomyces coryli]
MATSEPAFPAGGPARKLLAIYLNDHLAGATSGAGLARRAAQTHPRSAADGALVLLATEIEEDRETLLEIMADLDIPVRRYKRCAAWATEKIARLKPNGRLLRRSGLSTLIELEALELGVEGKLRLWQTLAAVADGDSRLDPGRLAELIDRARQQLATLRTQHAATAAALFAPVEERVAGSR